ncbi:hypothetical protein GDO81_003092 [Engystomops pustulosus]|uniref:Uncharacterized protein n=1 Tax=Engystomops pustulosus TaxID=76066 RepID=A0AAV7A3D9_ENGPU|nr:hypothetical protein GDO81_003092 [Engystomops pustulosus]
MVAITLSPLMDWINHILQLEPEKTEEQSRGGHQSIKKMTISHHSSSLVVRQTSKNLLVNYDFLTYSYLARQMLHCRTTYGSMWRFHVPGYYQSPGGIRLL